MLFLVFRVTSHTGLDAYYWLSPQGVIWIVLVQALTALSVFTYFRREHPSEQSWKTTVCAWLGFAGQIFVLALFYHFETSVTGAGSIYVEELFTIGSGTWSVPVSWLGIIGVAVPVVSMATPMPSAPRTRRIRAHGPLRQRRRLTPRAAQLGVATRAGQGWRPMRQQAAVFGRLRHSPAACASLRVSPAA